MRGMIPESCVDLVYLDPPFNSNATYNVLFKPPEELGDAAQIKAFEDTWHWTVQTEREYAEILKNPYGNSDLAKLVSALRQFLGENDMLAYLVHMANRLLEIRRVMKDTASIYLHCDPTASHYLKLVMDAVFGFKNYCTEIIWKRTSAHSDTKQGRKQHGRIHDVIFFYTNDGEHLWNPVYTLYDENYTETFYRHIEEGTGRRFRLSDLTAAKPGGDTLYEWKGVKPYEGRYWAYSKDKMQQFEDEGRLYYAKTGMPQYKRYLDEMPGVTLQDLWTDIKPTPKSEKLSYPTQKPLALMERIISASSNEGDTVLDPFCGCGTTVHAAEQLKRSWLGIDITHLAINLIRTRLTNAFGELPVEIIGLPASYAGALELARADKHEFELWVLGELDAMPYKGGRKGADTGIDGYIFFRYLDEARGLSPLSKPAVRDGKAIVEVKGGGTSVKDVRNLDAVVEREGADLGVLVSALKPSGKMYEHAAGRGPVTLGSKDYPKLQVVWLKDLMEGRARVEYPESGKIEHAKKAPRHKRDYQEEMGPES